MKIKKPGSNPPTRIEQPAPSQAAAEVTGPETPAPVSTDDEFVLHDPTPTAPFSAGPPAGAPARASDAHKMDAIYQRSLAETDQKLDTLGADIAGHKETLFAGDFGPEARASVDGDLSKLRRRHRQLRQKRSTMRRRRAFLAAPVAKATTPEPPASTPLAQVDQALGLTPHGAGFVQRIQIPAGAGANDFGSTLAGRAGQLAQATAALLQGTNEG